MKKNKRILILNNYSVNHVSKEIIAGLKPSHHLYGILELENAGYELIIIDPADNVFWRKMSALANKIPFSKMGDLEQQIKAFKRRAEYDLIYAPCQNVTQFLGLLSYFGLFNKKIIAVAHHPFDVGRASWLRNLGFLFTLKKHFKWGALSTKVAMEINTITKSDIARCFHWGPELSFYDNVLKKMNGLKPAKTVDIIAVGRTGRDYQLLIDAFNKTNVKVEIYCAKEFAARLTSDYTDNIKVIGLDEPESIKYPELIKLYLTAKIIAIPLKKDHTSLVGLTSITDAIALGMPIMMTRNNNVEINIEEERIGYWIDDADSTQWRSRAQQLLNSDDLMKFSANSRKLAELSYNSEIYLKELLEAVENV